LPNGKEEDCDHKWTNFVLKEGYIEEHCMACGELIDRWQANKDKPADSGPA